MGKPQLRRGTTATISISASPHVILSSFFAQESLTQWWRVRRSLCVPRVLGCYALEWEPTERRDDVLGRLGGVFHGTVMTCDLHHEFFVAEAYWMAPDGDPVGPMAFEVSCVADGDHSRVTVRMSGADTSERWDRYYAAISDGLTASLERLKTLLEERISRPSES